MTEHTQETCRQRFRQLVADTKAEAEAIIEDTPDGPVRNPRWLHDLRLLARRIADVAEAHEAGE